MQRLSWHPIGRRSVKSHRVVLMEQGHVTFGRCLRNSGYLERSIAEFERVACAVFRVGLTTPQALGLMAEEDSTEVPASAVSGPRADEQQVLGELAEVRELFATKTAHPPLAPNVPSPQPRGNADA